MFRNINKINMIRTVQTDVTYIDMDEINQTGRKLSLEQIESYHLKDINLRNKSSILILQPKLYEQKFKILKSRYSL